MPLDAVFLSAVIAELSARFIGSRVDKIFMPARSEAHLLLRGPQGNGRLLIAAGGPYPRLHETQTAKENPAAPPMFCMLLRKHLQGAKLAAITQPPLERIVRLTFDATDELGVPCQKSLVAELMGRHSNLILLGGEDRILDCLVRVDMEMSSARQVLPGLFYRLPPTQGKQNPFTLMKEDWMRLVHDAPPGQSADAFLLDHLAACPPLVCRELSYRASGRTDAPLHETGEALWDAFDAWRQEILSGQTAPYLLCNGPKMADYCYTPIRQYEDAYTVRRMDGFGQLLDVFYAERDRSEQKRQASQTLLRQLSTLCDRLTRKLALQQAEWAQTEQRDTLKDKGDLLMSYASTLSHGQSSATLPDFTTGDPVQIALDPRLTAVQNASRYYKQYQKARNARATLTKLIEQGRRELEYLESVREAAERIDNPKDLLEIREELNSGGYVRIPQSKKKQRFQPGQPLAFCSSTGRAFRAGRNNRQNDLLTGKLAARTDMWLHAQKIPGCHVVIACEGGAPDETTLYEAAVVAATLSRGVKSPKVPVDYTQVKFVKKPPGAKPGMVIYDNFKTILAAPDTALLERLRQP